MSVESRGRKSAAELSVVRNVVEIPRPSPPDYLTQDQAALWRVITNRHPADHFPPETHGELSAYCEHTCEARYLSRLMQVEREQGNDLDRLDRLQRMHERQTRAASSLATRMRMTQQATMNAKTRKQPIELPKPWDE